MAKFSEFALSDKDTTQQHNALVTHLNSELSSTVSFTIDIPPIAPKTVKGTLTVKNGIVTAYVLPS